MTSDLSPYLNRVICGDCLDVMRGMPSESIDAVVTDPPFAFTGGISNGMSSSCSGQFFGHWWRDVCSELTRIMKPTGSGFIWCDWKTAKLISDGFEPKKQTYNFWRVAQMLYHYREMPGQGQPFRSSIDMIAYVRGPKHKSTLIPNTTHNFISKYWYYGKHEFHPAEKSPEIVSMLLDWCSFSGDVILDLFAGSGVVGLNCAISGREYILMDSDPDYCRIAEERIKRETQQLNMFHTIKQQEG